MGLQLDVWLGLQLDLWVGLNHKGAMLGMLSVRHDMPVDTLDSNYSRRVLERLEDEDVLR